MKFELFRIEDVLKIIETMDAHPLGAILFIIALFIAATSVIVVITSRKK